MRYFVGLFLIGFTFFTFGCSHVPTTIDALSNNTSGDMVRGVKLKAGIEEHPCRR